MKIDPTDMRANIIALQQALKGVDGGNLASANVKDVSMTSDDAGLTITFNAVVDGVETPVVLSMAPELEPPDGSADEVAAETLLEKLDALDISDMTSEEAAQFMQELLEKTVEKMQEKGMLSTTVPPPARLGASASGDDPPPATGNATLFNLLEILALIVKVAQDIKKSAKTIKAAENDAQATAYEQQASKMTAMAEVAKDMGLKYTVVSAVMLGISAIVSIGAGVVGAAKGFLTETKANGVAADASNSVMGGPDLDNDSLTAQNMTVAPKVQSKLGADQGAQQAAVTEIRDAFTGADSPVTKAKTEYQTAVNHLESLPEGDQQRPAAQADVAEKKTAFVNAVMDVKGRYDADYVADPSSVNEAKMTVANEFAMKTLKGTQVDVTRPGQDAPQPEHILTGSDCAKIRNGCDKTYRTALKDESHYVVAAVGAGATHVGQLMQMINQYGQSETNYEAQGKAAEAQEEQADATRKQKDYEETKSLEDAAQAVIDAARQTMQKAYASQRDLTKEIFG